MCARCVYYTRLLVFQDSSDCKLFHQIHAIHLTRWNILMPKTLYTAMPSLRRQKSVYRLMEVSLVAAGTTVRNI